MKLLTKILIALLVLTSFVPIKLATICLFFPSEAVEFFGLDSRPPGLDKVLFILGGFIVMTIFFQYLATWWLLKRKQEGFTLAYTISLLTLARGALFCMIVNTENSADLRLALAPMVIGLVLLICTFFAHKSQRFEMN